MTTLTSSPYALHDNDIIIGEDTGRYVLRVRDLPLEEKPREKLIAMGSKNLRMAEIMAIVLGVGTKKEEVLAMAERIIKEYGEKSIMHETRPAQLAETLDIPLAKACQIVACFELGRRFFEKRHGKPVFIRTTKQAYGYVAGIAQSQKEQLRGLYLSARYEVIHDEVISIGSLTANIVHPREVFQPAIERGAVAVILAHNHPSGNSKPTAADIAVTHQLKDAGQILGIDLLDHLVVTGDTFTSIMEGG